MNDFFLIGIIINIVLGLLAFYWLYRQYRHGVERERQRDAERRDQAD